MNKATKFSVILIAVSFFLFSVAIFYSFAYRPWKKERNLKQCLAQTESTLHQKQSEVIAHTNDLKQQKEIESEKADKKLDEFIKNNPEPKKCFFVERANSGWINYGDLKNNVLCGDNMRLSEEWRKWDKDAQKSFDIVRDIEQNIRNAQSDFARIEEEKKTADDKCYKDFK